MKTLMITLALLAIGCEDYGYNYDLDEYDLDFDFEESLTEIPVSESITRYVRTGQTGISLHLEQDSSKWKGSYTVDDQPEKNYCAPTAGKNILEWYGVEASYEELGYEMSTNDTEPGFNVWSACALACGGEIAICANSCYAIVKRNLAGTSPKNIIKTMTKFKPPGYELNYTANDPSKIEEIIYQLTIGNPVIVLEHIGEGHVSVITGIDIKDGEIYVIAANSYRRTLDEFMYDWSLKDSGGKVVRRVLAESGARPFTAIYFESNYNERGISRPS